MHIIKRFYCKLMQGIHSGYGSGMDQVPDPDLDSWSGLWSGSGSKGSGRLKKN
jgi:hypothetical protein